MSDRNPFSDGDKKPTRSPFADGEHDPSPSTAAGKVRRRVDHDALRGTKADRPRNVHVPEVHQVGR